MAWNQCASTPADAWGGCAAPVAPGWGDCEGCAPAPDCSPCAIADIAIADCAIADSLECGPGCEPSAAWGVCG